MLSSEVAARLERAHHNETQYYPNAQVSAALQNKTFIMLVGPAAVGKSFTMNYLAKHEPHFERVPVITTRDPRSDDEPGMFRYFPHDDAHVSQLLDQIEARELVEYVVHPTTGRLYASTLSDYPAAFNLLATLSNLVDHLRTLPFGNTYVIGLGVEPTTWLRWFKKRYATPSPEKTKRLHEAIDSLTWLLRDTQHTVHWVENTPGQPAAAAHHILEIIKHQQADQPNAKQYAAELLKAAKQLLAQDEQATRSP